MRAAYIEQTGAPEVIRYGDLPDPQCGPEQVVVRVRAVSVNPIDTYIRNGANYWPLKFPFVIGADFAGEVIEIGSGVDRGAYPWLREGVRVWGSNQGFMGRGGCFAEKIAIDPAWAYPTPEGVEDSAVAACALVGITAGLGLFERVNLRQGESVFVRGGTGGVGSMVVQMARAAGARVIATAGSEEKAARCRELGAEAVIRYRDEEILPAVQRFADGGVQVFWETLREPDFDLAVAAMAENARMVLMAGRDARPPFPVGPFYVKGCSLVGFVMFKASPAAQRRVATRIGEMLAAGTLKPQIDRVLPLSEAAEAHRLQESSTVQKSGELAGKLVLTVD